MLFLSSRVGELMPDKPIHNINNKDFGKLFKLLKKRT